MSFEIHVSGHAEAVVDENLPELVDGLVASGLAAGASDLWGPAAVADAEVRLGWTQAVSRSRPLVAEILQLRAQLQAAGRTRVVLAGMGGSSLAPEVIAATAGAPLEIVDSTVPSQVLAAIDGRPGAGLAETVLVVSSKSGSTVETDAILRAFVAAWDDMGLDAREHVVVVTDPDSALDQRAQHAGYRVFHADPTVGGRYSALTAFGLVPAGLAGADIEELLDEADATLLEVAIDDPRNPALVLAAAIAGGSTRRDKLALVADGTHIVGLPDWIEQLVAESTGKQGTGILPVVMLPVSPEIEEPHHDVLVVRLVDDAEHFRLIERHPGEVLLSGALGAQFVVWEHATAIVGRMLGINPFDQPDVEAAKAAARTRLDAAATAEPAFVESGIAVFASSPELVAAGTIAGAFDALFARAGTDGYVGIHAYLDRHAVPQIAGLRELVAADAKRPTTFGWGPRFLHSTGQYHKGGPASGVFVQLIDGSDVDLDIPDAGHTFARLLRAQADGDAAVLAARGMPVLTLVLPHPSADVQTLFEAAQ